MGARRPGPAPTLAVVRDLAESRAGLEEGLARQVPRADGARLGWLEGPWCEYVYGPMVASVGREPHLEHRLRVGDGGSLEWTTRGGVREGRVRLVDALFLDLVMLVPMGSEGTVFLTVSRIRRISDVEYHVVGEETVETEATGPALEQRIAELAAGLKATSSPLAVLRKCEGVGSW